MSHVRLRAASFAGDYDESRRQGERRTRVRHPTHTDLPVDSVQFNAAVSRVHIALLDSALFSSSLSLFLARIHYYSRRKHLAPPVRNARASLTLGGLYRDFFVRDFFSGYSSSRVPITSIPQER